MDGRAQYILAHTTSISQLTVKTIELSRATVLLIHSSLNLCMTPTATDNRKLHLIVANALRSLYRNNAGDLAVHSSEYLGNLAQLEQDLLQWRNNLPSLLKIHFDSAHGLRLGSLDDTYARQGVILYLRYNNCVTLLHRPHVFAALCGQSPQTALEMLASTGSINVCMKVSKDTLVTIQSVHSSINHLGAWWYTLYYSISPISH
jgi:hypothetical protein